ncbi:hypothetical protein [Nocardia brasiliensis]
MGMDAFVRCRCWQDGCITAAPVPAELIVEDGDGYLTLSVPYVGNEDQHHRFDRWIYSGACPHEQMQIVSERIANWGGYRLFQGALKTAGAEQFPTLSAELPDANGGQMSPTSAAAALIEVAAFRTHRVVGTHTDLVDDSTGETLITAVPAYNGVFIQDGRTKHNFVVDAAGLTIVDTAGESKIFRAHYFTQQRSWRGGFWFTDLDTGRRTRVLVHSPINPNNSERYPRRMRVHTTPVSAERFDYITQPLTRVFQASIDTGNPVVWT